MTPLRLVVLAILFYILYRLLTGIGKKKSETKPLNEKYSSPVSDALVEDPVCHTLVPKGQALRLQHENQIYYFCSEACCSRFISEKGEQK
ncbi:MAG: YHS domain-containing protein [Proteobacteria bacterium]|nr:YHS domain-containing protein [Pseudomonadota bacterium]MBU1649688.1 YHS domain-containing protein [Pseudomonadota bacterium]MBU1986177.1 YHS domain-containing protein [Pseudomonadota bacterium]